jgi:hypothetical protein
VHSRLRQEMDNQLVPHARMTVLQRLKSKKYHEKAACMDGVQYEGGERTDHKKVAEFLESQVPKTKALGHSVRQSSGNTVPNIVYSSKVLFAGTTKEKKKFAALWLQYFKVVYAYTQFGMNPQVCIV